MIKSPFLIAINKEENTMSMESAKNFMAEISKGDTAR